VGVAGEIGKRKTGGGTGAEGFEEGATRELGGGHEREREGRWREGERGKEQGCR
jgi:hypothetical protein